MKVAYNAIGKSDTGIPILGHVFFESRPALTNGTIRYKILAYHFVCNTLVHFGAGAPGDCISIVDGPTPDLVVPGMSLWQMGAWVTDVGVVFQGVDNVVFNIPALKSLYKQLPPRIELICTFPGPLQPVPFVPKGWLKLIWDPQFSITKGLPLTFFDDLNS
jgi:hypothetical protein